jgi:hypothetical protein
MSMLHRWARLTFPWQSRLALHFWEVLHVRMRKLHNRLDGATYAKVLGAVHSRIPMVTADEQVALQTENAEVEAQFWSQVRDFHAEQIKGQGQLAATASDLIAEGRTAMTDAATRADAAQDRVERLRRGENLSGGLGEPLDVVALLKQEGFTTADLRHAEQLHALGGGDLFQDYLTEFLKRRAASERRTSYAAQRAVLRRHGR